MNNTRQYRATRLWNDVVRNLRSSMPVGRHRKNMRMYDDSFVASEAVDWLHQHLKMNPNFEPDVTRDQTIALLKKFQKMGIIQDARGPDHKNVNVPFEDNSRLFKITNVILHSPAVKTQKCVVQSSPTSSQLNRPTGVMRTPLSDVTRRTSNAETMAGWRHSVPSWIGGVAPPGDACESPPPAPPGEPDIGIPYIDDTSPIVRGTAPNVASPLPDIVCNGAANANCDETEGGLGDMHVWLDVLLTRLKLLLRLKRFDDVVSDSSFLSSEFVRHNFLNVSQNGLVTNIDKNEHLPYWILSAMKYLARSHTLDESEIMPGPFSGLKSYQGFECDMFVAVRDYFRCLPQPLIPTEYYDLFVNVLAHVNNFVNSECPAFGNASLANSSCASAVPLSCSWDGSFVQQATAAAEVNSEALSSSCAEMMQAIGRADTDVEQADPVFKVPPVPPLRTTRRPTSPTVECLETSFDGATTAAVTRRRRRLTTGFQAPPSGKRNTVGPVLPPVFPDKLAFKSPDRAKCFNTLAKLAWSPRFCSENDVRKESPLPENQLARQTGTTALNHIAASDLSIDLGFSARRSASFNAALNSPSARAKPWTSASVASSASTCDSASLSSASSLASNLPRDRDALLTSCLQLCCLLLPPARRRRLHLLLRFMAKIAGLKDLCLAVQAAGPLDVEDCKTANRNLVISSFAATILRKRGPIPVDHVGTVSHLSESRDVFAHQLTAFFIDHYAEVMRVPEQVQANIEDRIASLERARQRSNDDSAVERPFCKQVSVEEYETSKEKNRSRALRQLLDTILTDGKLTTKARKRRLRQFKAAHPQVYSQRFPSASAEAAYMSSLPRDSVFGWTLQKLRNMRL